jgi:hypothetical protein
VRTQQVDPDLERTGGMADGARGSVLELRIVERDVGRDAVPGRENLAHVYDEHRFYFVEHHFTRLAMEVTFVSRPKNSSSRSRLRIPITDSFSSGRRNACWARNRQIPCGLLVFVHQGDWLMVADTLRRHFRVRRSDLERP